MRTFIRGIEVDEKATSYTLFEKVGEDYNQCGAPADEINFEISNLGLKAGEHVFVVRAEAVGTEYEESDYSIPITYTVPEETVE